VPVKIDPLIVDELASMDLAIWSARHPKVFSGMSEKTGKAVYRENKQAVSVTVNGPGLKREAYGYGTTLRLAIDDALVTGSLADRVRGIRGAVLRLEAAIRSLSQKAKWERLMLEDGYEGDLDDYIPF
jgi:hypothetical protein